MTAITVDSETITNPSDNANEFNNEVSNIIFSLNQDKSDGPNSISIKILNLLNKDMSYQFTIIVNQSFSSGIVPSVLKTSKIIPVYKKSSKVECSNYRPISLLSNISHLSNSSHR